MNLCHERPDVKNTQWGIEGCGLQSGTLGPHYACSFDRHRVPCPAVTASERAHPDRRETVRSHRSFREPVEEGRQRVESRPEILLVIGSKTESEGPGGAEEVSRRYEHARLLQ